MLSCLSIYLLPLLLFFFASFAQGKLFRKDTLVGGWQSLVRGEEMFHTYLTDICNEIYEIDSRFFGMWEDSRIFSRYLCFPGKATEFRCQR
ncbi:hypothetical protein GYMLUDRAFT_704806 [Collybiopsis luxurians FD-317 M1]|uniref:Uncharacterized protein n=1 Tax=Collybiopsis luxurians FD-317 M1 TaxID=944289 RepID=A0A0D0B475_9AGAR|nr:hypothetical protein GYMLUDRAFT_704806 [Collybiopsis luxurians FD-317 M1]